MNDSAATCSWPIRVTWLFHFFETTGPGQTDRSGPGPVPLVRTFELGLGNLLSASTAGRALAAPARVDVADGTFADTNTPDICPPEVASRTGSPCRYSAGPG